MVRICDGLEGLEGGYLRVKKEYIDQGIAM